MTNYFFYLPFSTFALIAAKSVNTCTIVQTRLIFARIQLMLTVCTIEAIPAKAHISINLINTCCVIQARMALTFINVFFTFVSSVPSSAATVVAFICIGARRSIYARTWNTRLDFMWTSWSIVTLRAVAFEAKWMVETFAVFTAVCIYAVVNDVLTMSAIKSCSTCAGVVWYEIRAWSIVLTWVCWFTIVNVYFAVSSCESRWTRARVLFILTEEKERYGYKKTFNSFQEFDIYFTIVQKMNLTTIEDSIWNNEKCYLNNFLKKMVLSVLYFQFIIIYSMLFWVGQFNLWASSARGLACVAALLRKPTPPTPFPSFPFTSPPFPYPPFPFPSLPFPSPLLSHPFSFSSTLSISYSQGRYAG